MPGTLKVFAALTLLSLLTLVLVACEGDATPAPIPVAVAPTVATRPPATPTAPPTPTLALKATNEWGVVKSSGTEVKNKPEASAASLERLGGFTLVAFQNKLPDESWWERQGGGWIARNDVLIYRTEYEARRSVPEPTKTPTAVPVYAYTPVYGLPTSAVTFSAVFVSAAQQTQIASSAATYRAAPPANKGGNNATGNRGGNNSGAIPVNGGVNFVIVVGGVPGGEAGVLVQTAPNASCSIVYTNPSGVVTNAKGLGNARADSEGYVDWVWEIDKNTRTGTGSAKVTCNGVSNSTAINIVKG